MDQPIACLHCGALNQANAKFCYACGSALSTNAGTASPPAPVALPSVPGPSAMYAQRPLKDRSVALILEILPGLFGLFGFGWIYSGNTTVGILWLLGMLALEIVIWLPVLILTAGFGCLCSAPANLVLLAVSAMTLNSYTKQHPELFGN